MNTGTKSNTVTGTSIIYLNSIGVTA